MDNRRSREYDPAMRTQSDRLRHTLMFEIIGLITCTPLAAWLLERDMAAIGTMSVTITLTAMACNYVFNLVFDHALVMLNRPVAVRPPWMRALHAFLFEASLLVITVPMVAWWLDMTFLEALIADIGFAVFFLVYAYVFNLTYDRVFPMPAHARDA